MCAEDVCDDHVDDDCRFERNENRSFSLSLSLRSSRRRKKSLHSLTKRILKKENRIEHVPRRIRARVQTHTVANVCEGRATQRYTRRERMKRKIEESCRGEVLPARLAEPGIGVFLLKNCAKPELSANSPCYTATATSDALRSVEHKDYKNKDL